MKILQPVRAAREIVGAHPARPATAIVLDTPDARLVLFRMAPDQAVPPHRNESTVMLTVLAGRGVVSGRDGEREVGSGDVVVYEPNELHGMRAVNEQLVLVATITPRPRERRTVQERVALTAAREAGSGADRHAAGVPKCSGPSERSGRSAPRRRGLTASRNRRPPS